MRISREFISDQYTTEERLEAEDYGFRIRTDLSLDSEKKLFDINTCEYHGQKGMPNESFGGEFIFSEWSDIQNIANLLNRYIREQDDITRSITISLASGTGYNTKHGIHIDDLEEATFTVDKYGLRVYAKRELGKIHHYTKYVGQKQLNRRNAIKFLEMVDELFEDPDEERVLHLQHPDLRSDALPEYIDGHYQSSVRTAFRVLEDRIRDVGDFPKEKTGVNLAKNAFNPEHGALTFADVPAEREGWMFLYVGGFGALRNPPSHRDEESIGSQRAMQILHFVDLLLDVLESEAAD